MKKISIVLLTFLFVSCVSEYKIANSEHDAKLQCLQPKKDMYLYAVYDLCPLFHRTPKKEIEFWRLVDINLETTKNLDVNNSHEHRVLKNVRDCDWPSRVTVVRVIKQGEHLNVKKIVLRSDSQSDQGLSIYGDVLLNKNLYKFEADIQNGYGKDVVDRIYLDFERCGSN